MRHHSLTRIQTQVSGSRALVFHALPCCCSTRIRTSLIGHVMGIGPRQLERFRRKEVGDTRVCLRPHGSDGTKHKCGFLTTETDSLFTEQFSDEKVPSSGHFRVRKELASCVCRSFQKYLALWDRSAYDMLCLNEVIFEPGKGRSCYLKKSVLQFLPP